ncbi:unnamed protein product [Phytomonas sp. Hart1]|nr:unnamed protein product [Phytomonas sp. Hart1]|eukprot:CCW70201.1 unnamed protein product [Phytomonas sp. isolate Hart1]
MTIELVSRISNLSPNVTEDHLRELLSMGSLGERAVKIKKILLPRPVGWQACPSGRAEVVGATETDTIKVYGLLHGAVVDGSRVNVSFAKINYALSPIEKPMIKGGRTTALARGNAPRRVAHPGDSPTRGLKNRGENRRSRSWSSYSRSSSRSSDSSRSSEPYRRRRRRWNRSRSASYSPHSHRRRGSPHRKHIRHSSRDASSTSSSSSYRSYSRSPSRSVRGRRTRSGSLSRRHRKERRIPRQRSPPLKGQRGVSKYN